MLQCSAVGVDSLSHMTSRAHGPDGSLREGAPGPLAGKRVLVTRAAHQSDATCRLLRGRGAEPVAFPTIAIEAITEGDSNDDARAALEAHAYDLVVFTSDNGVRGFFDWLRARGLDASAFGHALVAAVGPATAAALEQRGVRVAITAEVHVAEGLADAILASGRSFARALLPGALVARNVLPATLRSVGMVVDVLPVYRTVIASRERAEELAAILPTIDVVMLTSGSSVERLVELLGADAPARLQHTALASIGPVTTETATALGLSVAVTAGTSTTSGLVAAMEAHFEGRRGARR